MGDVVEFVTRSSRWTALRYNRAYVADWRAHAGGPPPLEPAPFRLRMQTRADLEAARWGLLAWEDPAVGMAASPFWVDAQMPRGRFKEPDDADPTPTLVMLDEAGATLTGLRLADGGLVLRIARGRKSGQVRLADAGAGDAARCVLSILVSLDDKFPENFARAGAVCWAVWPWKRPSSAGRRCPEW